MTCRVLLDFAQIPSSSGRESLGSACAGQAFRSGRSCGVIPASACLPCSTLHSLLFVSPGLSPAEGPSYSAFQTGPSLCNGSPKTPWDPVSLPHLLSTVGNLSSRPFPTRNPSPFKRANSNRLGTCLCPEPGALDGEGSWVLREQRSVTAGSASPSGGSPQRRSPSRGAVFPPSLPPPLTQAQPPRFCAPVAEFSFRRARGGPHRHSGRSPRRGGLSRAPAPGAHGRKGGFSPSSRSGAGPRQMRALHGVNICF